MTHAIDRQEGGLAFDECKNHVVCGKDGYSAYIEEPTRDGSYQSVLIFYNPDKQKINVCKYTTSGRIIRTDLEFSIKDMDPAVLVEALAQAEDLEEILSLKSLHAINPKAKFLLGSNN